jgi:isopenicillin N synthase-like dioxygenase
MTVTDAVTLGAVPVVDLAPARTAGAAGRHRVAEEIRAACEELGFFVITGHGVAQEKIDSIQATAQRFFDMPLAAKQAWMPPSPYIFRGYFPIRSSALAGSLDVETPPDLCEVYAVNRFDDPAAADAAGVKPGREGFFAPNIWPDVAGFREAWTAYYSAMEDLSTDLMRLMALALDLDEHWFDDKVGQHISNLVANHYPAQETPPSPGQLRRGAHTDYGSLTVLYQDDQPGGLQVQLRDGSWADVPHIPGSFVVNLGDLMAAWTNDRWVSTMHRVVNPPRTAAHSTRISIPFFHQPDYDALIECIPTCTSDQDPPHHRPVTSGEWVLEKLSKSIT